MKKTLKMKEKDLILKAKKNTLSKNFLYTKFLGSLIKKGNKSAALRILQDAFLKASVRTSIPAFSIFNFMFRRLNTFVEVKRVKKRKNTHYIPLPIKKNRNQFLKIKWLLEATKEDKRSVNFSEKLQVEILNLFYRKKKSKVLLKRKNVKKEVLLHKANAHFRW